MSRNTYTYVGSNYPPVQRHGAVKGVISGKHTVRDDNGQFLTHLQIKEPSVREAHHKYLVHDHPHKQHTVWEELGSASGAIASEAGVIGGAIGKHFVNEFESFGNAIYNTGKDVGHFFQHPGDSIIKGVEGIQNEAIEIYHHPKRILEDASQGVADTLGVVPLVSDFIGAPVAGALHEYYTDNDVMDYALTTVKYGIPFALDAVGVPVMGNIGMSVGVGMGVDMVQNMRSSHNHFGDERHATLAPADIAKTFVPPPPNTIPELPNGYNVHNPNSCDWERY
jgi:hypothetical protein